MGVEKKKETFREKHKKNKRMRVEKELKNVGRQ